MAECSVSNHKFTVAFFHQPPYQRIEAIIASNLPTQDLHFWWWVHDTLRSFFKSVDEEVVDL